MDTDSLRWSYKGSGKVGVDMVATGHEGQVGEERVPVDIRQLSSQWTLDS